MEFSDGLRCFSTGSGMVAILLHILRSGRTAINGSGRSLLSSGM